MARMKASPAMSPTLQQLSATTPMIAMFRRSSVDKAATARPVCAGWTSSSVLRSRLSCSRYAQLVWSSTTASWVVELKAAPAGLLHPPSAANQGSASQLPPTTPPTPRLAPDRVQLAPKYRGRHLAVKQTPTRLLPKPNSPCICREAVSGLAEGNNRIVQTDDARRECRSVRKTWSQENLYPWSSKQHRSSTT